MPIQARHRNIVPKISFEILLSVGSTSTSPGSFSSTSALQILVENVDTETFADANQVGVVFGDAVDDLRLWFQQAFLDEIGQVRIALGSCGSVQVQQSLSIAMTSKIVKTSRV